MTAPLSVSKVYQELHPGCFAGVPNSVYHAATGINNSALGDLLESPEAYEYYRTLPQKQTIPMLKGSALHCLALQPELYDLNYKVGPTKTRNAKAWKEFAEENEGYDILTQQESDDIERMCDALHENPATAEILSTDTAWKEISVWGKDPKTGIICKIRPDIVGDDGYIYDVKTTIAPQWRAFKHSIWKWGYFRQAPFYMDIFNNVTGRCNGFRFLVVGSKPPHSTAIYELDNNWMQEGRDQYREALDSWFEYIMGDGWGGFPYGRETKVLTMESQE